MKSDGITRREFIQSTALGIGGLATMGPHCVATSLRGKGGGRPNILFILTDDQRWDAMGCSGNRIIKTPNMDSLARNGVRFENAFVTTPICAASRASIFTGLHERTHGFTFRTPPLSHNYTQISYPFLLRRAGYQTGFIGKFGVQVEKGDVSHMFDTFVPLERTPYVKAKDGGTRHLTDICGDESVRALHRFNTGRPFCLSISFHAPHAEDGDPRQYLWPEACDQLYEEVSIPKPKQAEPDFFESQPRFLQSSLNRVRWGWRFDSPEKYQTMIKGYYRMISGVDMVVGRIMAELKALGLDKNTIVILMSDNGYFLGERGFAGKWLLHESSIRVPMIMYDPRSAGTHAHGVMDQMVLNIDMAPTILDMAGVPIPEIIQGRSLTPLLRDKQLEWRGEAFFEHLFDHDRIPQSEGIRTTEWKYIRYRHHPEFRELYDLSKDPIEEVNLAYNMRYRDRLDYFDERCEKIIKSLSRPI